MGTTMNSVDGNGNRGGVSLQQFQIPIGFRFRPTDEELLVHYLKRKVHSIPLPASIIPELNDTNIFHSHPSQLPGDVKERRYFFYKRKRGYYNLQNFNRRMTTCDGCGYWKARIGKDKAISSNAANTVVGAKKTFIFYHGKSPHGLRTCWVLHEYHLLSAHPSTNSPPKELENWVVCSIYERKRKGKGSHGRNKVTSTRKMEVEEKKVNHDVMMDLMTLDSTEFGPALSSPSCSSSGIPSDNIIPLHR